MSRSSVVACVETFREHIQDYTSAVIGEDVFRIYFRFTPGYAATWTDPGEGPEIEFLRAERETFAGGERLWVPVNDGDEEWCSDWLDRYPDEAIEEAHQEMADRADRAAEARMEEERRR